MMQQLANFIVDHDPMMVLRRTHDTVRYIRWAWNKDHAHPIDEEELRLFLCDEHYGDLTDEQRAVARQGRDEMRSVYAELCVRWRTIIGSWSTIKFASCCIMRFPPFCSADSTRPASFLPLPALCHAPPAGIVADSSAPALPEWDGWCR